MDKRLNLSQLKVTSFVTSVEEVDLKNLKGGNSVNASCNCTPPVYPTYKCTLQVLDCITKP